MTNVSKAVKIGFVGWASLAVGGLGGCRSSAPPTPQTPIASSPSSLASPSSLDRSPEIQSTPNSPEAAVRDLPQAQTAEKETPSSQAQKSPSILGKIRQDITSKVVIAKQDSGKTFLSNVLVSQQAEKLVKGRFNPDLKRLSDDTPLENDEYRLEVRQADASQAIIVAIAKQPGFASYTGIVRAIPDEIPAVGICKTNIPSQSPPSPPKPVKQGFICGAGASTAR